jgi:hypothetical protein
MKRPRLDDARSTPACFIRGGTVCWQDQEERHAPHSYGMDSDCKRTPSLRSHVLGGSSVFIFLAYLLRSSACGIARTLRCLHKIATSGHQIKRDGGGLTGIGVSTDATGDRDYLMADICVLLCFLQFLLVLFFMLPYCSLRNAWHRKTP